MVNDQVSDGYRRSLDRLVRRCVVCKTTKRKLKKRTLAHAADLTLHKHFICDACWLMLPEE